MGALSALLVASSSSTREVDAEERGSERDAAAERAMRKCASVGGLNDESRTRRDRGCDAGGAGGAGGASSLWNEEDVEDEEGVSEHRTRNGVCESL